MLIGTQKKCYLIYSTSLQTHHAFMCYYVDTYHTKNVSTFLITYTEDDWMTNEVYAAIVNFLKYPNHESSIAFTKANKEKIV